MGITVHDERFRRFVREDAEVERLWTGGTWTEGPAWMPETGRLVFVDIPSNRMLRWEEASGAVAVLREPSARANGNTTDHQGRLVTCEQATRRITRTEVDGTVTVLADRFEGKRFNAPNDIVVASDAAIWFTDPDYGKAPDYEGELELDGCHVYRLEPSTGAIRQMTTDMVMPNGLAFSPDEQLLYVSDTGSTHRENGPNHIRRFLVGDDWTLSDGAVFATDPELCFDGFRVDRFGNLWCGGKNVVRVYAADGAVIGEIAVPERVGNLCFGGADGMSLLMCGSSSLYRLRLTGL